MAKVFLSYSHRDFEFVKALYDRLKADGIQCFLDKESTAWGSNWVMELEKGVDECDLMLVVLSKAYCESEWTRIENTSIRVEDPAGLRRKIRPLLLEDCSAILPRFFKPIQSIDVSSPERLEQEYPRICRELGGNPTKAVNNDTNNSRIIANRPETNRLISGKAKLEFCKRLGDKWLELAVILEIPSSDQDCFPKGREAYQILDWLERRNQLYKLPGALIEIGRQDLADLLPNPD